MLHRQNLSNGIVPETVVSINTSFSLAGVNAVEARKVLLFSIEPGISSC
jgi:hypothetical protein